MALLEADVNYKVVKDFVSKISERAVGQEVLESLTPGQQVIKIVHEELIQLMGGTVASLQFHRLHHSLHDGWFAGSRKDNCIGSLQTILGNKVKAITCCLRCIQAGSSKTASGFR